MIVVKLREAMEAYETRTGDRITYQRLAELTGLARTTLESIATRAGYNASLQTIDRICRVLGCTPGELLVLDTAKGSPSGRRTSS